MKFRLATAAITATVALAANTCGAPPNDKPAPTLKYKCQAFLVTDAQDHGYEEGKESRIDVFFKSKDCTHILYVTISNREWLDSTCSPDANGKPRYWPKCLNEDPLTG